MGSWIAFQQFIGLQQWGSQFDPDWVVSKDGFNDAGGSPERKAAIVSSPLRTPSAAIDRTSNRLMAAKGRTLGQHRRGA
jgi:hypothetical protein